ncbi:hypothetical protein MTR_7g101910 [Medicago truncatula]|uniref:Uncharacterized protein n=1 Tax=Medicago truncatula TaxID=3880 RepID=A0A072U4H2_MEDTR|nr:hypothetical protein MTR_7g101910 [Medicago truncatula]
MSTRPSSLFSSGSNTPFYTTTESQPHLTTTGERDQPIENSGAEVQHTTTTRLLVAGEFLRGEKERNNGGARE